MTIYQSFENDNLLSVTPILKSLHWLPIRARIEYKILLLTFKCIHGTGPEYLCQLIEQYNPSRSLRSCNQHLLVERDYPKTKYGYRSFKYCAPILWNSLPYHIRAMDKLEGFKAAIKTHLFEQFY